jgi:hypothetical protein
MTEDTVTQGLRIDGLRASKRVGLAKAKTGLLDLIGLDDASGMVDGFRISSHRNEYDEETARVKVESPPGMYLAVVNGTKLNVYSSESDSTGISDMGEPDGIVNTPAAFQYAPSRFVMTGLQAEGIDTVINYERQPGSPFGTAPYVSISGSASSPVAPFVGVVR